MRILDELFWTYTPIWGMKAKLKSYYRFLRFNPAGGFYHAPY